MNSTQPEDSLTPSALFQLQEEDRFRLAQALSKGPGQVLANALLEVEYAMPLIRHDPEAALRGLDALCAELRGGLAQVQETVAELQPPLLGELGIGASLRSYLERFRMRTGMQIECIGCEDFDERYPMTIETSLFRVAQEALINVEAHSGASRVQVRLERTGKQIRLSVKDNGQGFLPRTEEPLNRRQLGLIAMRDRVELLGGQLQVFSDSGQGVRVVAIIPYHGHADANLKWGEQGDNTNKTESNHNQAPRETHHNRKGRENGRKPDGGGKARTN